MMYWKELVYLLVGMGPEGFGMANATFKPRIRSVMQSHGNADVLMQGMDADRGMHFEGTRRQQLQLLRSISGSFRWASTPG